jgi:hydrogenase/urease accessory protein HupE
MRWLRAAVVAVVAVSWPATAEAHLVSTGLGPLYDGISHLLVSPDDLLPVLVAGVMAGMNGAAAGRYVLFVLPVAWLLGGTAALSFAAAIPAAAALVPALSLMTLGTLTAADRRLRPLTVVAIASALGIAHGWLNGAALAGEGRDGLALIGIAGAIFVTVALAAALVVSLHAAWARVAARAAGSWGAAIGLLMAGWAIRAAQ